jgi:hypothetical protein
MGTYSPETCTEKNKHTKKNCAPSWLYLQNYTRMHGQQNMKHKSIRSDVIQYITIKTLHCSITTPMECAGPLQRNIIFTSIQSCDTEGQVSPIVPAQEWRQSNLRNALGDMRDYSHMYAGGHFQRLLST